MFVHRLKLRPPQLQPSWLPRPSLEVRVHEGARVLSVVAGPGYGKTVLASQIFESWEGPKLWYSLDTADADLAVFAMHLDALTSSVHRKGSFGAEPWRLASPKDVGGLFAEAIADVSDSLLIVLDDVHALRGSRALTALDELVQRAARIGTTFVLCGRSMPLSLHPYAAAGQLASLGSQELAFDVTETRAYLDRVMQRPANGRAIAEIAERAEGWPAGLALIASTAGPRKADGGARTRVASDEARQLLFDYLATEALAELSDDERDFLLETSVLERLEVSLCDAALERGDSSEMLESLARRGLFMVRHSADAYTCHQLFREFLLHTLERSRSAAQVGALRRRVADVLTERGDLAGAIHQRLDAGDVDKATASLDRCALSLLRMGLVAAVGRLLERIDAERIAERPALLMARGRLLRERGDWDAALATLERAILGARRAAAYDVLAESVRQSAQILASRGEFERLRGMLDAALGAEELPEESATTLRMTLAAVYIEIERFDDALAIFHEITPSVIARGDDAAQGSVLHNMAVAHLRRGDLFPGLALYERALKLKQGSGQRVSSLLTLGDLVYTRMLLGDLDEAERLCESLLEAAHDYGSSSVIAHAHENQGMLRIQRKDFEGAERAFTEAHRVCDPGDVLVLPDIQHGLAQCALAKGRFDEADELCSTAITSFRGAGKLQQMAPIMLTRAKALVRRGDMVAAHEAASEAVGLAAQGADAVLQAVTCIDAAALLAELARKVGPPAAALADGRAAEAAKTAVALLHQRGYRFLLRTKEAEFETLRDHLRRWNVGHSLLRDSGQPGRSDLRIEMLGGFEVFVGGRPVPVDAWKRRKARDIFAYLVNARGRSVPRSRLADLYWGDLDADAANDNLRVTISAIRKAVGSVVKFEADGYRFTPPDGTTIDRDGFDDLVAKARDATARGKLAEGIRHYRSATQVYRGDFLDGMDEGGWQWHERERLRAACLEALRALATDASDPEGGERALDRLLELAPFDLDAVRLHLERLVRQMRMADARRDYAEWRARYRAAVGAEPPTVWESFATPA